MKISLTSIVLLRVEGTESNNNLPHKVANVGNKSALHKIRIAETVSDKGDTSTLLLRCSLHIHSHYMRNQKHYIPDYLYEWKLNAQ